MKKFIDLFTHTSKDEPYTQYQEEAKKIGQQALDSYIEFKDFHALNEWYYEPEFQEKLIAWFNSFWDYLKIHTQNAMPAHDMRHALIKVPISAIECIKHEKIYGAERLSILGAILHDTGRWAEEYLYGGPSDSVFHARAGYILGHSLFLKDCPIDSSLKGEILHSILTHTTGANPTSPLFSKIVVSADRAQLVGPEYSIRLMHHLAISNENTKKYTMTGDIAGTTSVVDTLFKIAAPLPEPTHWLELVNEENCPVSMVIYFLLKDAQHHTTIEIPPLAKSHKQEWAIQARVLANKEKTKLHKNSSVTYWLAELLNAPYLCKNEMLKKLAMEQFLVQTKNWDQKILAKALAYIVTTRKAKDEEQKQKLEAYKKQYLLEEDFFLANVISKLLEPEIVC